MYLHGSRRAIVMEKEMSKKEEEDHEIQSVRADLSGESHQDWGESSATQQHDDVRSNVVYH